jgi:hypothetical protein
MLIYYYYYYYLPVHRLYLCTGREGKVFFYHFFVVLNRRKRRTVGTHPLTYATPCLLHQPVFHVCIFYRVSSIFIIKFLKKFGTGNHTYPVHYYTCTFYLPPAPLSLLVQTFFFHTCTNPSYPAEIKK